jgi:hypothetical protein
MKLRDRKLERRVRRGVQREIRQSPEEWREYRSRRWRWRRWVLYPTIIRLAVPLGMVLMPVSFSLPLVIGFFNPRVGGVVPLETIEFVFGLYSFAITCLLMAIAGFNDRAYVSSNRDNSLGLFSDPIDLRVLAHLPLPDRIFCSPHSWVECAVAVFVAVLWLGAPFAVVAWKLGFDLAGCVTSTATMVLVLLTVVAALMIVCAYSPTRRRLRQFVAPVGLALFFGTMAAAMIRVTMGDLPGMVPRAFLWLTPYGWVSAAFIYGYIDGNNSAWLMLIPAAAFVLVAIPLVIEWLRSDFAIKEFVITSSGWHGVIERGFRVPKELPEPPPLMPPKERPPRAAEQLGTADAARITQAAEYLRDRPWSPFQVLERFRDVALTRRERLILRIWSGTYEQPTIQWLVLLALLSLVTIVICVFVAPAELELENFWVPLFLLFPVRYYIRREATEVERWRPPRFAGLPIEFREACRAAWKQELFRAALMAPLLIVCGLTIAPLATLPA